MQSDALLMHSWVTLQEVALAFALAMAVAIPLAIAITTSRLFEKSIYPLLVASQVTPLIAIAPLFVVWFGFGMLPKVLIACLIAFFPMVIETIVGLKSLEIEKLYLAQSMGASRLQIFLKIRLPHALPIMFGGFKVAGALSVIGAVVGEFVGTNAGLGHAIIIADGNLDAVGLFAALGYLATIGVTIFFIINAIERILIPWHVSRRIENLRTL